MSDSDSPAPSTKHDPLAALRQPKFVLYTGSRLSSAVGNAMLQAILAWHVYQLTDSAMSLGFLGLARFLPSLGLSMVGGAVADSYNRRNIIMVSQMVLLVTGIVLAMATLSGWVSAELIYLMVLLVGLANAFEAPARLALLPAIVRPETFANAVTVSSTLQSLGMVTGLLAGGILVGLDAGVSYVAYSTSIGGAFVFMGLLRYQQPADGTKRGVSVAAIKEGIAFVRSRQVILGSMSLDMFAVIFGGAAKGLLPIFASDILQVGGFGYGLLLASMQIGALAMSAVLLVRPPIYRTGRALVYSVVAFGLLTIAFGFSRDIYLSIAVFMGVGAADQISVVMRNVIIQLATPDALRGRVSSVNQVFVQASNQLGAMEAGFVAAVTSATFAVVMGGAVAVGVAGIVGWKLRELFDYRTEAHSQSSEVQETGVPEKVEEPAAAPGG